MKQITITPEACLQIIDLIEHRCLPDAKLNAQDLLQVLKSQLPGYEKPKTLKETYTMDVEKFIETHDIHRLIKEYLKLLDWEKKPGIHRNMRRDIKRHLRHTPTLTTVNPDVTGDWHILDDISQQIVDWYVKNADVYLQRT